VKCTVFSRRNIEDFAAMNAVYATYFPEGSTRALHSGRGAGSRWARGVEIECIAATES